MPRYELDEYVQEHLAEDGANVNCVASWHGRADAAGHVESLYIDFHNSWYFDSRCWKGRTDAPARLLTMLQRNECGTCGSQRVAEHA
jgi:hypothetical protein